MSKGLRLAAVAAVLAVAGGGSEPAWAQAAPCSPSGTSLALTAELHKFDRDCLAVTAGESFTIRFDNRDSDRHNVAVLPAHTATETVFAGDIVPGPKSTVYAVPNMKAGTYHFHCEVHPNLMNGTFVVAAAPAPRSAGAAQAPKNSPAPAAAAAPKAPPKAAPTPVTTRGGPAAGPAGAAAKLPRTGPGDRALVVLAGLVLAAGGLSVLGGAKSRA